MLSVHQAVQPCAMVPFMLSVHQAVQPSAVVTVEMGPLRPNSVETLLIATLHHSASQQDTCYPGHI